MAMYTHVTLIAPSPSLSPHDLYLLGPALSSFPLPFPLLCLPRGSVASFRPRIPYRESIATNWIVSPSRRRRCETRQPRQGCRDIRARLQYVRTHVRTLARARIKSGTYTRISCPRAHATVPVQRTRLPLGGVTWREDTPTTEV